ncbi:MAG TPA: iron ABC transporter permease [Acidimicrobiia bacterium]|nr:iron ABC transporter permease [Acidimicrobiia bacterium]
MTAPLAIPQTRTGPVRYRSSRAWWLAAGVALLPGLIPPLSLAIQVIGQGTVLAIPTARLIELFVSTMLLTWAVTTTAVVIGMATSWVTTRVDLPFRRGWMTLAALPLVVPSYVAALSLIAATGPNGVLFEVPTPYGFVGAWLVLSIFTAPMVHLTVIPGLRAIDPATEEAATGLGADGWRVFRTVTLPQLRPALVSSALLVGLYTVSDFGAVSLLRYDTFTRAIYTLYRGQIDRRPAATLSLILMALAIVILLLERRTRGRAVLYSRRPRRDRPLIGLSGWRLGLSLSLIGSYALFALGMPLFVMAASVGRGLEAGQLVGTTLGAEAARSLGVAVAAALITALAAFPVAMVTTRRPGRLSGWVESAVWGTYALPHITVGVAAVGFALQWARPFYQTLIFLLIIYVALFLPQAVGAVQDSLRRASPDLEDASRGLGRGPVSTLLHITLPLATPGLIAGAALVFLSAMKELPATILLRPNGFETLAIRIWSSTSEGFLTRASAAGLVLLVVSIVPLFLVMTRDLGD